MTIIALGLLYGRAALGIRCWVRPTQSLGGGPSNWESPPALAAASLLYLPAPIHFRSGMKGARKVIRGESHMFRVCTRLIAILLLWAHDPIEFALAAPVVGGCGSRSHASTVSAGSPHRPIPRQSARGQDQHGGTYLSQVSISKSEWHQARQRTD